jgi:hypothetical protein
MKVQLWGAVAATVVGLAIPAYASADPPVPAPPGSDCTFESGTTTCVQTFALVREESVTFSDPSCPSGAAERRTVITTTTTTTTVFRGTKMLGEPQTETVTTTEETVTCVDA